jgi:hypothetical protein
MAATFISKLFGLDDDTSSHARSDVITVNTQASEGAGVHRESVNIRSTVSSDSNSAVLLVNYQKVKDLVFRLGKSLDIKISYIIFS